VSILAAAVVVVVVTVPMAVMVAAMAVVAVVRAVLLLATLVEGMVEYLLDVPLKKLVADADWRGEVMKVSAALVGVLVALLAGLDIFAPILGDRAPLLNQVLTGLVIGRGANYAHDLVSGFGSLGKAPVVNLSAEIGEFGDVKQG
jgi:hypothetical protein